MDRSRRITVLGHLAALAVVAGCTSPGCPDGFTRVGDRCLGPDAGVQDSGTPERDSGSDSGPSGPPPLPAIDECAPDDATRYAVAHRSRELVSALVACSAAPCPDDASCTFSSCVRSTLGVASCGSCVAREMDCLLRACPDECGVGSALGACAHCVCRSGCADEFNECSQQSAVYCEPCHATEEGCPPPPSPLSVALIVAACF